MTDTLGWPDDDDDDLADLATVAPEKQRGGIWSDAVRARALERYIEVGPSQAAKELGPNGPDKSTITRWAKAEGLESFRNPRTEAATLAASVDWKHRRMGLANDYGDASDEYLSAGRAAVRSGKANDARSFMIGSAVAVDKADQLSGVSGQNSVNVFIVDMDEQLAVLERLQAEREQRTLGAGTHPIDVDSSEVT